jgi:hypothetical protein
MKVSFSWGEAFLIEQRRPLACGSPGVPYDTRKATGAKLSVGVGRSVKLLMPKGFDLWRAHLL